MRFWYNALFITFFLLSAPWYFLKMRRRGNWKEGFATRFGKYDSRLKQALTNRHVIWVHAVSVGEVNIATHLIRALEMRLPNVKIVVSTTTSTGMAELQKKLPHTVERIYYPIDRKKFVNRALRMMSPEAIILVEAEIWPNFLWGAASRRIPVFLVNTRLSEKSYRGYKRFAFLFRPLFQSLAGVGVQNAADAERVARLGCTPEAIRVVGNLKFDSAKLVENTFFDVYRILRQLGLKDGDPILVGGSTHAGEEAVLARVVKALRHEFPRLFLIAVPRHQERGREAGRDIEKEGLRIYFRNEIAISTQLKPGDIDCLVVNTTGELRHFYDVASVIFVGKSLTAEGGQNPIEPAAIGKAIVFGPNMQNFEQIAAEFVRAGGAIQVADEQALTESIRRLLRDEQHRRELGQKALAVVKQNQGSIEKTVEMIVEHLKDADVYIRP